METKDKKTKKTYVTPKITKHKAIAVISGSSSSSCNSYSSRTSGGVYYY